MQKSNSPQHLRFIDLLLKTHLSPKWSQASLRWFTYIWAWFVLQFPQDWAHKYKPYCNSAKAILLVCQYDNMMWLNVPLSRIDCSGVHSAKKQGGWATSVLTFDPNYAWIKKSRCLTCTHITNYMERILQSFIFLTTTTNVEHSWRPNLTIICFFNRRS